MAELDTSFIDFFRTRAIERSIHRTAEDQKQAEAEYAIWWWTDKKRYLPCSKGITWPDGQEIICSLPVHHVDVCRGAGTDGHERAFSVR